MLKNSICLQTSELQILIGARMKNGSRKAPVSFCTHHHCRSGKQYRITKMFVAMTYRVFLSFGSPR